VLDRIRSATTRAIQSTNHRHNYGQLLILDASAGGGIMPYATWGMFVVTGEPVAVMDGGAQSAVAKAGGANQPVLYVEFRNAGVPVDPGPWWAANEGQKVRG
jgi:septal ring factor EnvC (AmiA/AmiB activator)